MQTENVALKKNKTWSLVKLPPNRTPIGWKGVYRVKEDAEGNVTTLKARLVAKGYHQQVGFNFNENFGPIVKLIIIRVILTLAVTKGWTIRQLDVNNIFLNGDLQEEIFMVQSPSFIDPNEPDKVCKLHKALYGLKQAPRTWFQKLASALTSLGFISTKIDHSLFINLSSQSCIYILIYVDDILITGSDNTQVSHLISALSNKFSLKDLGTVNFFLGIPVIPNVDGILLSQQKYIQDLLCKAEMQGVKTQSTPMNSGLRLSNYGSDHALDPSGYRSIVGVLQYATITRPDIAFSVNKVCQFMRDLLQSHIVAVKRILRYLDGSLDYGLHLQKATHLRLEAYCDAD
uniref:Reverse transcriptase Ty1/copia-type domain-containing protein n=1 Tax=Cannabis sativa TaxID=3483 RepID=A0A803NI33_CANSA